MRVNLKELAWSCSPIEVVSPLEHVENWYFMRASLYSANSLKSYEETDAET